VCVCVCVCVCVAYSVCICSVRVHVSEHLCSVMCVYYVFVYSMSSMFAGCSV